MATKDKRVDEIKPRASILVMGSDRTFERIKNQHSKNDVHRFEQFWEVMEYLHKHGKTVDSVFFTERVRYIKLDDIKCLIEMAHPNIEVHLGLR